MFNLTLIDHLRLTFGHVVYQHKAHAHRARSWSLWSRALRGAEALLMAGVTFSAIGAAAGRGSWYAVVSAALAGIALLTLLLHLTFDFEGTARAHAWCAAGLWRIRERYRALLSDLADGVVDVEEARNRRDALMADLQRLYETAPPLDAQIYRSAAQSIGPVDESALTDEEIDLFLPKSLQKSVEKTESSAAVEKTESSAAV
jgi:conflict system pore-forming effector with SLATT domain